MTCPCFLTQTHTHSHPHTQKTASVDHNANVLAAAKETVVSAHVLVALVTSVSVVLSASVPAEIVPASLVN